MTTTILLDSSQIAGIRSTNEQNASTIVGAARSGAITNDTFVYFAAFDGTNNDGSDASSMVIGDRPRFTVDRRYLSLGIVV